MFGAVSIFTSPGCVRQVNGVGVGVAGIGVGGSVAVAVAVGVTVWIWEMLLFDGEHPESPARSAMQDVRRMA